MNAISKPFGGRAVVENMSQMRVALSAKDFISLKGKVVVFKVVYTFRVYWLSKTRPSGT